MLQTHDLDVKSRRVNRSLPKTPPNQPQDIEGMPLNMSQGRAEACTFYRDGIAAS
jgi:hypothetical protein